MLYADLHIMLKPVIRCMHDLIDRNRADDGIRVRGLVRCQRLLDIFQPDIELLCRSGIQRRERAHDTGLALLDHERRPAGNEHGR